ncbi:hypothetical protein K505DRAFT_57090 [Melanomma pulvis-pyrius CBS 109.77]|uniref:Uncharacterized protein n=1 Tax=Melanomma pulvis-pyrius CBS 109.77 TaxID=1314802 RepID=A0A6A6X702_9PLEO|nr:hypothetical protein K505DRAFT_57090 [Melanomma pulvis-pyrius CBS 109.77]
MQPSHALPPALLFRSAATTSTSPTPQPLPTDTVSHRSSNANPAPCISSATRTVTSPILRQDAAGTRLAQRAELVTLVLGPL